MNETVRETHHPEPSIRETSEESVWEAPAYVVVETALEVTAYALGDR
ncbi:pyrroloquinoline quinone precursor peptide PqqA [Streptomyces sp. NPDC001795]